MPKQAVTPSSSRAGRSESSATENDLGAAADLDAAEQRLEFFVRTQRWSGRVLAAAFVTKLGVLLSGHQFLGEATWVLFKATLAIMAISAVVYLVAGMLQATALASAIRQAEFGENGRLKSGIGTVVVGVGYAIFLGFLVWVMSFFFRQ